MTEFELKVNQGITSFFQPLDKGQVQAINQALIGMHSIPAIFDRRLLASCRTALGRDLTMEKKKRMRAKFIAKVKEVAGP